MFENMKLRLTKKFTGTKWAIAFVVVAFFAGLSNLEDGDIRDAELSFLTAGIVLIGTTLYFLGKKRVLGEPYRGTKIIEGILLSVIVIFLFLSILSGSWYQSPLTFSVIPAWILLAYYYLHIAKINMTNENEINL